MLFSNLEVLDHQIEYFSRPDAQLSKVDETENGTCLYLDESTGNKCAIGCLLEEEEYWKYNFNDWEGQSIDYDLYSELILFKIISDEVDLYFLQRTQMAHDTEANSAKELVELLIEMRDNGDY